LLQLHQLYSSVLELPRISYRYPFPSYLPDLVSVATTGVYSDARRARGRWPTPFMDACGWPIGSRTHADHHISLATGPQAASGVWQSCLLPGQQARRLKWLGWHLNHLTKGLVEVGTVLLSQSFLNQPLSPNEVGISTTVR
jgi:hypothetical protein